LEGRKLDILKKNNKVCFEMAYEVAPIHVGVPCNVRHYFASVIGYGEVVFIQDIAEKCEALSIMYKHQTGKDVVFDNSQCENICVYKIVSIEFTGKKKGEVNS
jgi:nitroimidazol reductase NimA-like FMN-containing flavoprotein (pyridoxamine 5'-phosphate oxidase superfamily)